MSRETDASYIWYPMCRIIRDYLVEEGVCYAYSTTQKWACATVATPDLPLNVVTIYDQQEIKRVRFHSGPIMQDPVVLIEVRSVDNEEGSYKSKEIMKVMDDLMGWTWRGDSSEYSQDVSIARARRDRGIFPMGKTEEGQWLFNMEFALVIDSIKE